MAHELVHALGFFHEQARADRDLYVKINEENIRVSIVEKFLLGNFYKTVFDHS